jgi:hypothetical protein
MQTPVLHWSPGGHSSVLGKGSDESQRLEKYRKSSRCSRGVVSTRSFE